MRYLLLFSALLFAFFACESPKKNTEKTAEKQPPFTWQNANMYFLMTDRFNNGDTTNDLSFNRKNDAAKLRGFMGGDIRGVIQKLDEGYFTDLGINSIWMTPVFEQIKGSVDEGYGRQYAFHGYWMSDWTNLDPNFGTMDDLAELVEKAHAGGIRIVFDVVLNHTGPVTEQDPKYPDDWVRTEPQCRYQSYESTVSCTLVENLPDILTNSDEAVDLPDFLINKWKKEGRYEQEMKELDEFFSSTGLPRAPRFYIMKWIADYVKEFGIDGLRVDTVKHVEESVWGELYNIVAKALKDWKSQNEDKKLDDLDIYYLGEVYNYSIYNRAFFMDGSGEEIDYYAEGFNSLINFAFKGEVTKNPEEVFSTYNNILLSPEWEGITTLNYIASHDDGNILDREREQINDFATMLMLTPGGAQVYYGDELGRKLTDEEATGDATLRTFMPWDELESNEEMQETLTHWQKLGQFRRDHVSIGAGGHQMITSSPYTFKREYYKENIEDVVVVVMDSTQKVDLGDSFEDGQQVTDYYSGAQAIVKGGMVLFDNESDLRLIAL
ncbi:MAG: alpha-amylase family glycosyl hydrolase [Cyclobacteriaceae bacterium]